MTKKPKMMKWVIEVEVAECWVADGYEANADRVKEAILNYSLGYAQDEEVRVKTLKRPSAKAIRQAQGYKL